MKLTAEQKEFIRQNYNKISNLIELTRETFGDDKLDGRTKEGRAVREFLAENNLQYNTTQKEKRRYRIFSRAKEFIIQYAKEGMSAYEISKIIFPSINITNLTKEVTEVAKFIEDIDQKLLHPDESAMNARYFPPKSISK